MPAEHLSAQDAVLWCAQASDAPLQIGALCTFDGGPLRDDDGALRIDELRRHVACCLEQRPRFRQRLTTLPFDQGLAWVDDPEFDIARHVPVARVAPPGDQAALRSLLRHLLEDPLDPACPLWELWIVDGLADGTVAVVPKVSHVLADGMAFLDFALSMLDATPDRHRAGEPRPWSPEPVPSSAELLVGGLTGRTRRAVADLARIAGEAVRPDRWGPSLLAAATVASQAGDARAPAMPFTAPVGERRDFAWTGLALAELLAVKQAEQVTLNDVVLAVVAGGLGHYLGAREWDGHGRDARVLVPVSMHGDRAGEEIENRFSMMVARLPTTVADPLERLRAVHDEMEAHKRSGQSELGPLLFTLGDLVPQPVLRTVVPPLIRRQPVVNLAVTNLPGSQDPLYLLGAEMRELYPYVTVTGNIALIIGVISYGDRLGVGVTVDADVVPDADVLVRGLELAASELATACRV